MPYYARKISISEFNYWVSNCSVQEIGYPSGFNGKENDNEIKGVGNSLDFGARMYDSRLGRWLSIDPCFSKYPFGSPYNFALNTPIQAFDPDGKLVIFNNGFRISGYPQPFDNAKLRLSNKDNFNYWGEIDSKFLNRIGDHKALYADGTHGIFTSVTERRMAGYSIGMSIVEKIKSGEVVLKKNEAGEIIESIKIVAHSQGSALAEGEVAALTESGFKVEVVYNIAPKQPDDLKFKNVKRVVQYGSDWDIIAPQAKIHGKVEDGGGPKEDGPIDGHELKNYENIFDIKKGDPGYVAPREDNQQKAMPYK